MFDWDSIRPCYVRIDLDALAHNMREVRRLTSPSSHVTAVIKADGYGHGAVRIAQTFLDNGADAFAVATLDEAIELRRAGFDTPVIVLGHTPSAQAKEIVGYGIEQTVYSLSAAQALSDAAVHLDKDAQIHIKIDTGMGRIGFRADADCLDEIVAISRLPRIAIVGTFTHFAVADETDKAYTQRQYDAFLRVCEQLTQLGVSLGMRNCANSAGIIDLPHMHMDRVRAGIILYGLRPSTEVELGKIDLRQAMSLCARITHVKQLSVGESVSYGRKFTTKRQSVIATLPLGYADGFTRLLSGKAQALVHGQRADVVGRICMDQCMLDVTDIPDVRAGEEAVLFGAQGDAFLSIDELAEALGTINYEIVCMIARRVPRVYVRNGQVVGVCNYLTESGEYR